MDPRSFEIFNRKRGFEKLDEIQEKIRQENIKIIKLHIDQASAITERDEKIATLNATNELLEEQVLQLQMENEKLSSKNEELCRRLEINSPNPEIEKDKFGGGAGVEMTSSPSFKFAEPIKLVAPIEVDGKLVGPNPEIEKKLKTLLEKHERQFGGGAGVEMTSSPSFKFAEPKLVAPIEVGGKLVGPNPEIEKKLKTLLEKHERQFGGGAGVVMTSFPSFKFEEPKLDPIDE